MDEKTSENGILYAPFFQNIFLKSKSHSLNKPHDQKTFDQSVISLASIATKGMNIDSN